MFKHVTYGRPGDWTARQDDITLDHFTLQNELACVWGGRNSVLVDLKLSRCTKYRQQIYKKIQ